MQIPETEFAHCGDIQIAYQVYGSGPVELIVLGGPAGHVEAYWEEPAVHKWYERLGAFARVATFDRRGTGASDSGQDTPTDASYMEDLAVVIEASGFRRPALVGAVEASRLFARFAATHREQVSALVLIDTAAAGRDVLGEERVRQLSELIERRWGKGQISALYAPSAAEDESLRRWFARIERLAVNPSGARQILELALESDVTDVLPQIACPTLVIHHRENAFVPIELGRAVADAIPNSRFVTVEGRDSMAWLGDSDALLGEIEEFLTGTRTPQRATEVAAILFTDVVGSTELATRVHHKEWQRLLGKHDELVRREIALAGGTVVKAIGDGFLATFETPHEAVRAAEQSMRAVVPLGLRLRAGLHVGAVEHLPNDLRGLAINIAARICELADGEQILVSPTARDILLDSNLDLDALPEQTLRGVPGTWRVYEVPRQGRTGNAYEHGLGPEDPPPSNGPQRLGGSREEQR